MRETALNKEAKLHRLHNQRRIAYSLIERARSLLTPGANFSQELHRLFRSQGKFGSKDRRLYRELIYTYLRYLPWLEDDYKDQSALLDKLIKLASPTSEIASLYPTLPDKQPYIGETEKRFKTLGRDDHELLELLPSWFPSHFKRPLHSPSLLPLVTRPPLWIRVQKDPDLSVLQSLRDAAGPESAEQIQPHPVVPNCIQAPPDFSLAEHPAYASGLIEIQDISSQILIQLLPERPSGAWLDACAGAGGKTLQLAQELQPSGRAYAFDTRPAALAELKERLRRAGLRNLTVLDQRPTNGQYDGVLVDAPCSGSGTWRRHPFLMRQTREQDVFGHADRQLNILKNYSALVAPGGLLVYCTCSLSRYENEGVAEKFLRKQKDFVHQALSERFGLRDMGQGITLYPEDFDGDGLYICAFRRK